MQTPSSIYGQDRPASRRRSRKDLRDRLASGPAPWNELPDDPASVARTVDVHCAREQSKLSYRRTMWILAWFYLNGFRRFDVLDPRTARVVPYYMDEDGNLEYQSTELLSVVDRVTARLNRMDVRPRAVRQGTSLAGLRDRAVAQVLADAVVHDQQLQRVERDFNYTFATLGSCGVMGHVEDHPTIGLTCDLEVVHPREIMPWPSLGHDHTKARGIVRRRLVPMRWLESRIGAIPGTKREKMDSWEWEHGHDMEEPMETGSSGYVVQATTYTGSSPPSVGAARDSVSVARITEVWIDGPRGTCSRYLLVSGDAVLSDVDLSGTETYCPLGFARFMDCGSFHGAGLFDLMFGICRELERMLKSLFSNIRDYDRYGVVVLPQGQLAERSMLRDVGKGLRVLSYSPDGLVGDSFRPFSITPHNAGDVPGKVAEFAKSVADRLSPVQDLLAEKGRVDSAAGLQFLDEQIAGAMNNSTGGVQQAFASCYRSAVARASRIMAIEGRSVPVSRLSLDLVGAVVDMSGSSISFDRNPIPDFSQISWTLREVNPRSEVARKQEALALLNAKVMDPQEFRLLMLKEGIDVALWMEEDRAAYESVVRSCIVLYNDGETPGRIVETAHTARPDLQLRVLAALMCSPAMQVASAPVKDAFKAWRETLISYMGAMLPAAVPAPEDMIAAGIQPGGVAGRIGPAVPPAQASMR